jgi:hypothetical protein
MENGMKRKSIILYLFSLMLAFTTIFGSQLLAQTPTVKLGWQPNAENNLSHYNLYRDLQSGTMVFLNPVSKTDTIYTDDTVTDGETYYYKLTAVDSAGYESTPTQEVMATVGSITFLDDKSVRSVNRFELKQNYPNPFNPTTSIEYSLPEQSYVTVKVYNVLGKEIKTLVDGYKDSGNYKVVWDGRDMQGRSVSSGIYFYQMMARDFRDVKRVIFQK